MKNQNQNQNKKRKLPRFDIILMGCFALMAMVPLLFSPKTYAADQTQTEQSGKLIISPADGELSWDNHEYNLPTATYGHQALSFNNHLYILGGTNNPSIKRTTLSSEYTALAPFATEDRLPMTTLYFHAATTDGQRIYLIGGNTGSATQNTIYYTTPNLDGRITAWTENSVQLPSFVQQHDAVIHNGYLYITGGVSSPGAGIAKNTILFGKLNANGSISSFQQTTPLPIPLADHRTLTIGDRLYVIGGDSLTPGDRKVSDRVFSAPITTSGLDIGHLGTWREEAKLPKALTRHEIAFFAGRIYTFGGRNALDQNVSTITSTTVNPDGTLNEWQQLDAILPFPVSLHQITQHGGHFYLLGGSGIAGPSNRVYYSDYFIYDQEIETPFDITITAIDDSGNVMQNYATTTEIDLHRDGSTFHLTPDMIAGENFHHGSATTSITAYPAGNDVKILAKEQKTFGRVGESNPFSLHNLSPILYSIHHDSAYNNAPTIVTITGEHFYRDGEEIPTISLGNTLLPNIEFISPLELRATIPAGLVPGNYALTITNPDGKIATLDSAFSLLDSSASDVIHINNQAYATNQQTVTLNLAPERIPNFTPAMMRFSNDGINFSTWEPTIEQKTWQLQAGIDDVRTVYVQWKDAFGLESGIFSDTIFYDATIPIVDYDNLRQLPDSHDNKPTLQGTVHDDQSGIAAITWEIWATDGYKILSEQPVIAGKAEHFSPEYRFTVPVVLQPGMYRVHIFATDHAGNTGTNVAHPMVFTVKGIGYDRSNGSISGVVTRGDEGIDSVVIRLYDADDQGKLYHLTQTDAGIPGQYLLEDVPTGTYKLSFSKFGEFSGEWFYGYTQYFSQATVIEVTAPWNSDNINFDLEKIGKNTTPQPTSTVTPIHTGTVLPPTVTTSPSHTPTIPNTSRPIIINNDLPATDTANVRLTFNPPQTDTIRWIKVKLSNDNQNFTEHTYQATLDPWQLDGTTSGYKTVYAIFIGDQGEQSNTFSDTIYLNQPTSNPTTNPTTTAIPQNTKPIAINNDAPATDNHSVTLTFNPPTQKNWTKLHLSNDNQTFTTKPYTTQITDWELLPGTIGGDRIVYVIFETADGTQSMTFSDEIEIFFSDGGTHDGGGTGAFTAEYFTNTHLQGTPALVRKEERIAHSWANGSPLYPEYSDSTDYFSARWTGTLHFNEAGEYRFTSTTDDGVRVWVDNDLIIDKWMIQQESTYSALVSLDAGEHTIRMEYYDYTNLATAKLTWKYENNSLPHAFLGQYFNNPYLMGKPAYERYDNIINFNWGTSTPLLPFINEARPDGFSVRWIGDVDFIRAGQYTFEATCDDGCRVWLDDTLLINEWQPQAATTFTRTHPVTAGTHQIWMEYQEVGDIAIARLQWWDSG